VEVAFLDFGSATSSVVCAAGENQKKNIKKKNLVSRKNMMKNPR